MKSQFIPIFNLPTVVILVDDDKQFLQNFGYKLGQKYQVKPYFCAEKALEYLNVQEYLGKVVEKSVKKIDAIEMDDDSAYTVFEYGRLIDVLYDPRRFDNISTLLIDYSMPKQMSGLEFCENIRYLPVRKIMLTGKADSNLAVDAFNRNIINRFIFKDLKDIMEQVCVAIEEETSKYFEEISTLVPGWKLRQRDTAEQYATVFFETIKNYNIVEHYQIGDSAYIMLDKNANIYWLIFQNQENLDESLFLGKGNHAPKKVLKKLEDRSHLLFLFSEEEKKLPAESWDQFTFPILGKANNYFYTLIQNEFFSLNRKKIKSYRDYMESCDG